MTAARQRLRDAGISPDEADLDARLLAEHALGWTTERFVAESREAAPPEFAARFDALVARRATREPFAYIVKREEFWGLDFETTPAVLIPRPETELLVELAIARCPAKTSLRIADVCTGSGCVSVKAMSARNASAKPNGIAYKPNGLTPASGAAIICIRLSALLSRIAARRCNLGSTPFTCSLLPVMAYLARNWKDSLA